MARGSISSSQFDFRPCSSILEALILISPAWHGNMEAEFSIICVFLDLAKAFDSVPHQGGIEALVGSCVDGSIIKV